jgi:AraC-like DNA-binding protein
MDVLSEVLKVIRLEGALFYNVEFSAPWSVRATSWQALACHFAPGAEHIIIYHLITAGRASVRLESGEEVCLAAGDLVMIPHRTPHIVENGGPTETLDNAEEIASVLAQGLKLWRIGAGGGEVTRMICGYMACDPQLARGFLNALPPVFKINLREHDSGRWLENTIRFSVENAETVRPGSEAVLAKLSEVLFVETLRAYISQLPQDQTGWLAGARDAEVGRALACLHRDPARPWTLTTLAEEAGLSRSVLAERFRHYLGETPIAYLTRWRLQLGAQRLTATSHSVAQVAAEVGYDSEAAFNRAFKREFQLPPAQFRAQSRTIEGRRQRAATMASSN